MMCPLEIDGATDLLTGSYFDEDFSYYKFKLTQCINGSDYECASQVEIDNFFS